MPKYTKEQIATAGKKPRHLLKKGMIGPDITWAQMRLNYHLGAPKIVPDGVFGPATEAKVKGFQRAKKITVDGIVGPHTHSLLKLGRGKVPVQSKPPKPAKESPSVKAARHGLRLAGITESPRGSNKVPLLVEMGRKLKWSPGIYNMGWSWCDYFVSALYASNGGKTVKISGTWSGHTGMYCPGTEAELLRLSKLKKPKVKKIRFEDAQLGDWVLFDWDRDGLADHIGFAKGRPKGNNLPTIEGNTSPGAAGSQSNGEGIYARSRAKSTIKSIWRVDG